MYNGLQYLIDSDSVFGGDQRSIVGLQADHILDLLLHPLRLRAWQIDFIDDREHVQIMIQSQVHVRQRLRLDSLGSIHHQHRSVAGRQRPAHLIIKIHMTGRIDQVQDILLSILCLINGPHRLGLDGDSSFPLQIHIVQHLLLHLPAGEQSRFLDDPVRQRGFAVVNVGDNTKISDFALIYGHVLLRTSD